MSSLLSYTLAFAATEDFTAYTEVDSDSDITVTSSKIDVSSMRKSANSSVYKDYTASYFGEFSHNIDAYITSCSVQYCYGGIWNVSNTAAATYADQSSGIDGYGLAVRRVSSTYEFYFYKHEGSSDSDTSSIGLSLSTSYYLTIARDDSTITVKVYSDSERTTLLDTLAVDYDGATFQYLSAVHSMDLAGTESVTYYVENLEFTDVEESTRRVMMLL